MIILGESAKWRLTESSIHIVPFPHISNKEIIWKLTGRERSPGKEISEGSKQG